MMKMIKMPLINEDGGIVEPTETAEESKDSSTEEEKKHPQEDEEYLLCVKCGKATCPGCD